MFPFKTPRFLSGLFRKKVKHDTESVAASPSATEDDNSPVYIGMAYIHKITDNAIGIKRNQLEATLHRLATKIELAPPQELPQEDLKKVVRALRNIANEIPEDIKIDAQNAKHMPPVRVSRKDWETLKSADTFLFAASRAYRNAGLGHAGQTSEQKNVLNPRFTEDSITISIFAGTLKQQIPLIEADEFFKAPPPPMNTIYQNTENKRHLGP